MLPKLKRYIGEILFPSFCCSCQEFGPYLCKYCYEKLDFYPLEIPLTSLPLPEVFLDTLVAAVHYEPTIGSVLHYLKYKHAEEVGEYLGDFLYYSTMIPTADLVTEVPLHPSRQAEREYNQSALIAKQVAYQLKIRHQSVLLRTKRTVPQATLKDQSARLQNLANIFQIKSNDADISGKSVLLIDDVCTTGSTLNECAKVLKAAGVKSVIGLVVAHGQ